MTPFSKRQRGEGKIGCVVILVILATAIAAGIKVFPVYMSNNELKETAKDMATRASVVNITSIEAQIKAKARELSMAEALVPGAITVKKSGDNLQGNCIVTLRYTRKIDFYGITEYAYVTDTVLTVPYLNAN
jgi:hypothetical protein